MSGNLNLHIKIDLGCFLVLTNFSSAFKTHENSDIGDYKVSCLVMETKKTNALSGLIKVDQEMAFFRF